MIIDGEVKLAKGGVDHFEEDAVVLTDGTRLPADLVVLATGYGSMNGWAADLISPEGRRQGRQGLGAWLEHDQGTPALGKANSATCGSQHNRSISGSWVGNLHQSRHYSLYLALQLKARLEGLDTPVYGLQEVHHLS